MEIGFHSTLPFCLFGGVSENKSLFTQIQLLEAETKIHMLLIINNSQLKVNAVTLIIKNGQLKGDAVTLIIKNGQLKVDAVTLIRMIN